MVTTRERIEFRLPNKREKLNNGIKRKNKAIRSLDFETFLFEKYLPYDKRLDTRDEKRLLI